MKFPKAEPNNNNRAGGLASESMYFGEFSRYRLVAVHTRFDHIQWLVSDANLIDSFGYPETIRQADTPEEAIAGLI